VCTGAGSTRFRRRFQKVPGGFGVEKVRFNKVSEKVPEKVPGGFGAGAGSGSTRFRRRFWRRFW